MAQLFLWTRKIDEQLQERFQTQFGFEIPEPLLELHENLPSDFLFFYRFMSIEAIIEEEQRPAMMPVGLVPFAEDAEGDMYCFYPVHLDEFGRAPIGIWMNESNHFLPITHDMRAFLLWWIIKELIEISGHDDQDDLRKMLEFFQQSCGLDTFELSADAILEHLDWHTAILSIDDRAPLPLIFTATRQFQTHGWELSLKLLQEAKSIMPFFGAASLWEARFYAMQGKIKKAHEAYWKHLQTPLFINGYHYWWHIGDLQIPENSEIEALEFFENAEIPPPKEILTHPKVEFLRNRHGLDFRERFELARKLEKKGDYKAALLEMENAFFLFSWDNDMAEAMLERLLCIYPEHDRIREAEQCRRALRRLREKPAML